MTPSRQVTFLLGPALLLVTAAIITGYYFLPPLPGGGTLETLVPDHDCVVWNYQRVNPPDQVAKLDLNTGRVSLAKLSQIATDLENGHGQKISMAHGIQVNDALSGDWLWRDGSLKGYGYLVGNRYLLRQRHSVLTILDMLPVFENPSPNTRPGEPMEVTVMGLIENANWNDPDVVQPIPDSNRFLCVSRDIPISVSVFEIESGQVKLIESWPYGGGPVMQHAGKVWSSAPKSRLVEMRSLDDLKVVQRIPLPQVLGDWSNIVHRNELISFISTKTGRDYVCRLDDWAVIPELDLGLWNEAARQNAKDEHTYLLGSGFKFSMRRIVVYDSQQSRIVYDAKPPVGLIEVEINDGHLVTVTEALGLTVELIDLSTGKLSKRYTPFLWHLVGIFVLAMLGLIWLVVWCYCSIEWQWRALPNIAMVTGLIAFPFLWRLMAVGYWGTLNRPDVNQLKVILFALCFMFSVYAAFGKQRLLLRISILCLWLTAVFGCVRMSGRLEIRQYFHLATEDGILRTVLVFTTFATFLMFAVRLTSLPKYFLTVSDNDEGHSAPIAMVDIFALVASIALLLTAVEPYRQLDWTQQPEATYASCWIMLPALLGLTGLVRNPRVYRLLAMLHVAMGSLIVLAIVLQMAAADYHSGPWYLIRDETIQLLCVMLATFVYCTLLRSNHAGRVQAITA